MKRNDPCPCGSGRKYKRCCINGDLHSRMAIVLMAKAEGKSVAELEASFEAARQRGRAKRFEAMAMNFRRLYGGKGK